MMVAAPPPPPPTGSWDNYNPNPPKKSKLGWIIGGIVAAVLVLCLIGTVVFFVTRDGDETDRRVTPGPVVTTPVQPQQPAVSVPPLPGISTPPPAGQSETPSAGMQKIGNDIKSAVEDFFKYASQAGFKTPPNAGYVLLGTQETATCNGTQLSGAKTNYTGYWCTADNKLYVEYSAYAKSEASGSLLTEAYLMHATAVGMTYANDKSSLDYKACVFGVLARADVEDKHITADQAVRIRDAFFKDKQTESAAYTAGYNNPSAQTCASY